jgi:hypothetical protein
MNTVYLLYTVLKVLPGACDIDTSIESRPKCYVEAIFNQELESGLETSCATGANRVGLLLCPVT